MINIIVPIVENVEGFSEFFKNVKSKDVKFFVGISEKLSKDFKNNSKNLEVHIFSNKAKKEEIVNSLHSCKMEKGKILVVRRPLTKEEFLSLTTSTKDISTLHAKNSRFVAWMKKILRKIIKSVFAFSYFEDISAICYNESMYELLSVCPNISMASRINKYVGVEIKEFETPKKQVKREYSRGKNALKLILGLLVFLGSIAGVVCISVFVKNIHVLVIILFALWLVVATVVFVGILLNFSRAVAVGDLRYGRAEEIKTK